MTLYVKGKSKKAINELLATGKIVYGVDYSMYGSGGSYPLSQEVPTGTVIKIFEKYIGGAPFAKAYGTWNNEKNKIM